MVIAQRTIFGQEHSLLNLQRIGSQPFLRHRDTVSIRESTQFPSLSGAFGLWEQKWNKVCLLIGKHTVISLTALASNFISHLEWLPSALQALSECLQGKSLK